MKNILFILIVFSTIYGCSITDNPSTTQDDWSFPASSSKFAVTLYCANQTITNGSAFDINVVFYNIPEVLGASIEIGYTSGKIEVTDMVAGPYFTPDSSTIKLSKIESDRVSYGVTYKGNSGKVNNGSGVVMKIKCKADLAGSASFQINLSKLEIRKPDGSLITNFSSLQIENLSVTIK